VYIYTHILSSSTVETNILSHITVVYAAQMMMAVMSPPVAPLPTKMSAIRRLSSVAARTEDVATAPLLVVPPSGLKFSSDAHETAVAMEMPKQSLNRTSSRTSAVNLPPQSTVTGTYAFAFDIDGVLMRGGKPIPEAIEALKVLNGQNEYGIKV